VPAVNAIAENKKRRTLKPIEIGTMWVKVNDKVSKAAAKPATNPMDFLPT